MRFSFSILLATVVPTIVVAQATRNSGRAHILNSTSDVFHDRRDTLVYVRLIRTDESDVPGNTTVASFAESEQRYLRNDPTKNVFGQRIVGGSQSDVGEFPYYVETDGCGGSLIAPNVVLSAAHCGSMKNKKLRVGAYRAGKATYGAVVRTVVAQSRHPNYNSKNEKFDFYLYKLNKPVTMKSPKLTINGDTSVPATGQSLTVCGLGDLSHGGAAPKFLQDVNLKAIALNTCNRPQAYNGLVDGNSMMCAGVSGGGKSPCHGDSGGPLVIRTSDNLHTQVGVVSWGERCAAPKHPGVFAKVSAAFPWIKQKVCNQWKSAALFCDGGNPVPDPTQAPTQAPTGSGGGGGDDDGQCINLVLTIKTDNKPRQTEVILYDDDRGYIWDRNNFKAETKYTFWTCLDPSGCATLGVFDAHGNGLSRPGFVRVYYDGERIYSGRRFGNELIFDFGDGCQP